MSKVSVSEQSPATSQWCRLRNTHSKSSAGMMYQNCKKKTKPEINMNRFNLCSFFSPCLSFLSSLVCGCSGGAVSRADWEELSCGWLQMRQLAGSDVPDGCVSLKYE